MLGIYLEYMEIQLGPWGLTAMRTWLVWSLVVSLLCKGHTFLVRLVKPNIDGDISIDHDATNFIIAISAYRRQLLIF